MVSLGAVDPAAIDELYGLPLDEFTPARNALAKELQTAGERDAASDVKKLKKPTLDAWAVNQLARGEAKRVKTLVELEDKIRSARSPDDMRAASDERRALIADLVARAEAILEEGGHAASASTVRKILQTLQAAPDEEERGALLEGRLTEALTPTGFGDMGGFDVAIERPAGARADARDDRARRRAERLAQEAADAESEAERLTAEAETAERRARKAASAAAAARERATKLRARAERAASAR